MLRASAVTLALAALGVGVTGWLSKTGSPLARRLNEALAGRHARAVHAAFVHDLPAAAILEREPLAIPAKDPAVTDTPQQPPEAAPTRVREIVREHPEGIFLTGEPGSGKTTTLRWLADRAAVEALGAGGYRNARVRVPVFVALDRIPNKRLDSAEYVIAEIERTLLSMCELPQEVAKPGEVLACVAAEHGVLVLLDGVNSVAARSNAVQDVMRSLRDMTTVTVVASGRTGVGNSSSLPEFELQVLNSGEERIEFLSAHAKARGESKTSGDVRYERLLDLELAKDLLANPETLWIADQVADRLAPPVTRGRLYTAYWEMTRDDAWGEPTEFGRGAPPGAESASAIEEFDILAAHCFHTLVSRYRWAETVLGLDQWELWMDRHGGHEEATRMLDHLADTTYLLFKTGVAENPFAFAHPTFVEYFAAAFLGGQLAGEPAAEQLPIYLQHPSMDNLMVFLAGMVPVVDRAALLDVLLQWDLDLAAKAVSEWPDSELAYRLPPDGRLLVEARAWKAALGWLSEHSDVRWAGGVASELADHEDTRRAALAWLESHPDTELSRQVARELSHYESARPVALAWLRNHPEDEWAWEAVLELVDTEAGRQRMLSWFEGHAEDEWAGRVASGLARHDDTRWVVLAWLGTHPEDAWAGHVARELADHDDTRQAVLAWLDAQPTAPWAGRVAWALARHSDTRYAARAWLDANPVHEWAGRVASELAGYDESRHTALSWLETDPGAEWASLVAWKLSHHDPSRRAMLGWLRINGKDDHAGRVASELADHEDTRRSACEWLERQPSARWAGRVARRLADYDDTRDVARSWLKAHPEDEWAGMVARKLATHADSRPGIVAWLRVHHRAWGASRVAAELADHDDSRPAVLAVLEEHAGELWTAKVLADHYDVRLKTTQSG